MEIVKDLLLFIQAVISIALIVIVMTQTTKNEGLTGNIGGPLSTSFKGKPGMEEQIRKYTIYLSVAWFIVSIACAAFFSRLT